MNKFINFYTFFFLEIFRYKSNCKKIVKNYKNYLLSLREKRKKKETRSSLYNFPAQKIFGSINKHSAFSSPVELRRAVDSMKNSAIMVSCPVASQLLQIASYATTVTFCYLIFTFLDLKFE